MLIFRCKIFLRPQLKQRRRSGHGKYVTFLSAEQDGPITIVENVIVISLADFRRYGTVKIIRKCGNKVTLNKKKTAGE